MSSSAASWMPQPHPPCGCVWQAHRATMAPPGIRLWNIGEVGRIGIHKTHRLSFQAATSTCPLACHATIPARFDKVAFCLGGPVGPELVQGLRLLGPVVGPALRALRERPHLPIALRESVRGLLAPYVLMRLSAPQAQYHRLMWASESRDHCHSKDPRGKALGYQEEIPRCDNHTPSAHGEPHVTDYLRRSVKVPTYNEGSALAEQHAANVSKVLARSALLWPTVR
eukprot:2480087-Amphidinium_carterae.5